jgi:hypothetical protein
MANTYRYTADEICKALINCNGMVYLASKELGCSPATLYRYRDRYASVRECLKNTRGEFVDIAEMALYNQVLAQQSWAVTLVLKTLGKDRGYVEKTETEIHISFDEELAQVRDDLSRLLEQGHERLNHANGNGHRD